MTRQEEREAAYALRDILVDHVDKYAPDDHNVRIAAVGGLLVEMGSRNGMSEIEIGEMMIEIAISGLPMAEQIAYREAHWYTHK